MKKINYFGLLPLVIAFFMFSCDKHDTSKPENAEASFNIKTFVCGEVYETELIAGKNIVVGKVKVEPGEDYLDISYIVESDAWWLREVHLAVYTEYEYIPQTKSGNPQIGLFPYKAYFEQVVKTHTIRIPASGNNYVIAAHAVVVGNRNPVSVIEEFNSLLPESATLTVQYPTTESTSYFTSTVTNGGLLDGTYEAWCIDTENAIYQNTSYTVKVYSSVDKYFVTLGLVDYPENMPLVNYILNQNYVGKQADELGIITFGDMQRAIWELIDDNPSTSGLGAWTQAKADWIIAEAMANGDAFVPDCGNVIAVVLVPVGLDGEPLTAQITIAQITIIEFPVECGPPTSYDMDETAWANGLNFKGKNWAMYFPYCK